MSRRERRAGLFRRIFFTFVVTVLVSAVVSAVGAYAFATRFSSDWIADAIATIDEHHVALAVAVSDADLEALPREVEALEAELGVPVGVYGRRGRRLAGSGPPHLPGHLRGHRRDLHHGPLVFREGPLRGPGIAMGLFDGESRRPVALLVAFPSPAPRLGLPLLSAGLIFGVLGIGAWVLSRSLAERLHALETSAGRIASGELRHRVAVPAAPADEIDEVGVAFNEMAGKVESLLHGQRMLLANVSHELRTPLARLKVLLEILGEKSDALAQTVTDRNLARLQQGLGEMHEDVAEIETLVSDLLTSGRLELRDGGASLELKAIDVGPLLERAAARVGAQVDVDPGLTLRGDALLLDRLLSNLLANARRACPDGRIEIGAHAIDDDAAVELTVIDEGPGIAAADREAIFEPFRRLDAARDRDRGGVGLGLYLCRQICVAHGGTIIATARPDGRSGACFVVKLPARGLPAAGERRPAAT